MNYSWYRRCWKKKGREGRLLEKAEAILEYWRRIPELVWNRGVVAYSDPFKNVVDQAIKRCDGNYGPAHSNLVREITSGLGEHHLDVGNVAMLNQMPVDLHQKLVTAHTYAEKTNAVMDFFERVPALREGHGAGIFGSTGKVGE